jgi:protein TonB
VDSPWHRLPWTLPSALLIWAVALLGLAYFMGKPTERLLGPPPIDAQLFEQSVSAATAAVHQPIPLPQLVPEQAPLVSKAIPTIEQNSQTQKSDVTSNATVPQGKSSSQGNIYTGSGARAIFRPMPQIPDDLREEAFRSAALVRFHIADDGSVKVELIKPTPNPRLNRILLDSLKKWRFIPAVVNGQPVASTQEIVVKIEVK